MSKGHPLHHDQSAGHAHRTHCACGACTRARVASPFPLTSGLEKDHPLHSCADLRRATFVWLGARSLAGAGARGGLKARVSNNPLRPSSVPAPPGRGPARTRRAGPPPPGPGAPPGHDMSAVWAAVTCISCMSMMETRCSVGPLQVTVISPALQVKRGGCHTLWVVVW